MSVLSNLKKSFNPTNMHGIWQHGDQDLTLETTPGTLVVAKDGAIPFVLSKLISKEVRIIGKVDIANDVTIRRQSEVIGTNDHGTIMEKFAMVMDYCRIFNSTLKTGAGFAHGGISEYVTWGAWAFANIAPILKGRREAPITIADGAYIGPGVTAIHPKVTAEQHGATFHANNYYIATPAFILNKTQLDPETLVPTNGWDDFYAGKSNNPGARFRPIALSQADFDWLDAKTAQMLTHAEGSKEYIALSKLIKRRLQHVWRLGARTRYLPPFTNVDTTQLADIGIDAWHAQQKRNKIHKPTLLNWLWFYHQTQHIKQVMYQKEAAKQFGDIVWHNAPLQSEILHLDRAHRILLATENPENRDTIRDLQNLIKAKLFLLGADKSKPDEHAALNDAFANTNRIISDVQKALGAITANLDIAVHRQAVIDHALTFVSTDNSVTLTIDANERAALSERLGQFAVAYAHVPGASKAIKVKEEAPRILSNIEIPTWIQAVNPDRVNFLTLADGPHVRSFAGHVPVIEDGVTLIGNVDLSGAVQLETGVTVINGSVASEQSSAPVAIRGKTILTGVIVHTATKEQYAVYMDGRNGPIVIKGGHVHGAEIDGYTFSKDALLSDESRIRGLVAEGAMNIGEKFAGKDGNLVFEAGSPSKNVLKEGGQDLADFYDAIRKLPEFKDVEFEQDAIKERIAEVFTNEYAKAQFELDGKVREYGPLYKVSGPLQVAILNLSHGAEILEKIGTERSIADAKELRLHVEGVEYLIGARDSLSIEASDRLNSQGHLSRAVSALRAVANSGRTIQTDNWAKSASPYSYSYADAEKLAKSAHRPVDALAQRNFELADDPRVTGQAIPKDINGNDIPGYTHVITEADAIRRGLHKTTDYFPNHITLIAQGIDHIPTLLGTLRKEYANQAQLTVQNRNGVAAPRLTL